MATSLVKTAPHFPGTVISVPDCRSGTHGVPGNNHAMQHYSGRSGKKSCRGTSDEGGPVFGIGFPSAWNIHPRMNNLFRSQGSGAGGDPPGYLDSSGAILASVHPFRRALWQLRW